MGNPAITPFVATSDFDGCPVCRLACDGETDARLHCYREHNIRLRLGSSGEVPVGRIDKTDIDAEVRTHLQVVYAALGTMELSAAVMDDIRTDAALTILGAILKWDRRIESDFEAFATRIVHSIALRRQLDSED